MNSRKKHVPIAICGYGHRLPGGLEDDQAFWDLLAARGYVKEPVADRYGKGETPWDGCTENPLRVGSPYEGLIKNGRELEFDCALFGLSESEAKRMDPQIKMMLSVTFEALQSAGIDQVSLHNSNTGVFTGYQFTSVSSWHHRNQKSLSQCEWAWHGLGKVRNVPGPASCWMRMGSSG